jgi:hypothetical protein
MPLVGVFNSTMHWHVSYGELVGDIDLAKYRLRLKSQHRVVPLSSCQPAASILFLECPHIEANKSLSVGIKSVVVKLDKLLCDQALHQSLSTIQRAVYWQRPVDLWHTVLASALFDRTVI